MCALLGLLAWGVGSPAASTPVETGRISHQPRIGAFALGRHDAASLGWTSGNWSGYAVAGSGLTQVTGSWIVPSVSPSAETTYSSSWIGIDGFNNSNLIQTGTEQDYYLGAAHYAAWWEILPAGEAAIPSITVRPGDHFSATITKGSASSWTITIADDSTGQSFSTAQPYTGAGTSAEWIQEAPSVGGRVAPLARYAQTTFDVGTVNGTNPRLTAADGGAMVQGGTQVSTPSNPDSDTDGFTAAYGSTQPAPPAS